ncbi:MAG: DUF302 domain-containing protein [Bacteroidales bacterium]|nr:DUF302 domain-containing protein [Bacteroidales bacterium]
MDHRSGNYNNHQHNPGHTNSRHHHHIDKTLNKNFEFAISLTKEALKNEGFGVLSEIDIQDKLKEKLAVDFRRYIILGACNPPLAYEALKSEDKIGAMLPCNVIVQELGQNSVEIAAVDPVASMMAIENKTLEPVAAKVKEKLEKVIFSIN